MFICLNGKSFDNPTLAGSTSFMITENVPQNDRQFVEEVYEKIARIIRTNLNITCNRHNCIRIYWEDRLKPTKRWTFNYHVRFADATIKDENAERCIEYFGYIIYDNERDTVTAFYILSRKTPVKLNDESIEVVADADGNPLSNSDLGKKDDGILKDITSKDFDHEPYTVLAENVNHNYNPKNKMLVYYNCDRLGI